MQSVRYQSSIKYEEILIFGVNQKIIIILIQNNAPEQPIAWRHCGQRIIISSQSVISDQSRNHFVSVCRLWTTLDHFGHQTPQIVFRMSSGQTTIYLGDGVNDSLILTHCETQNQRVIQKTLETCDQSDEKTWLDQL